MVFWAACAGLLLFGMALATLSAVSLELRARFGLDEHFFAWMPFSLVIGTLLFGPVCNRYGYKCVLTGALAGFCIGACTIVYACTKNILWTSIFFSGVFSGVINGATLAVVADISPRGKSASLSLLCVSLGIGVLCVPVLREHISWRGMILTTGGLALVTGIWHSLLRFPSSRNVARRPFADNTLWLIGCFLFFQSSIEIVIYNWSTAYMLEPYARYALSIYIAGFTVMRLLAGSLFRTVSPQQILYMTMYLVPVGILLLQRGLLTIGLMLLGAGLAGGFPVMLGFVGERYMGRPATAFGIVLVMALAGNILVDAMMGWLVKYGGVQHLITVALVEWLVMMWLCGRIVRRL